MAILVTFAHNTSRQKQRQKPKEQENKWVGVKGQPNAFKPKQTRFGFSKKIQQHLIPTTSATIKKSLARPSSAIGTDLPCFFCPSAMLSKLRCLVLLVGSFADGFFVTQQPSSATMWRPSRVVLKQSSSNSRNFGDDDSSASFDVEAARQHLETLVGGTTAFCTKRRACETPTTPSSAISPPLDVVLPPRPIMTSAERARRLAEQKLLAQLTKGDESLTDLWNFWFQERGAAAAKLLRRAEQLTGEGPDSWDEAEAILATLMEEHGVYWAEPLNRLATLYFMQGRLEESETLCQMVLAVKPWHFGALSGLVTVYAGMHESEKARQWAARRLPSFSPSGPTRRRIRWVETALQDAQAALANGEQLIREWMGPEDDYQSLNDVWQ